MTNRLDLYNNNYDKLKEYFKYNKKKYICLDNAGDMNLNKIIKYYKNIESTGKFSDILEVELKDINTKISIKKLPVTSEEKQNMYNSEYPIWRELKNYKITSKLVKKWICPNLQLYYGYFLCNLCSFRNERIKPGLCLLILKEHSEYTFHEWIISEIKKDTYKNNSKKNKINFWKNIYFQIFIALFAIQKHYYLVHGDLHWDNILVNTFEITDKTEYLLYVVNGMYYYLPNIGFQLYLTDFGKSVNFSKYNLILKSSVNLSDSMKSFSSSSDNNLVICGIDYNIVNIYKWIDINYKMNISEVFPEYVLNMLKDIKFKYRDTLPNEVIHLFMHNFLDDNINKKNTHKIEKCTNIKNIKVGKIVVYNNKYACIHNIDIYNIELITNKETNTKTVVHYKKIFIIEKYENKYNIVNKFKK